MSRFNEVKGWIAAELILPQRHPNSVRDKRGERKKRLIIEAMWPSTGMETVETVSGYLLITAPPRMNPWAIVG